MAVKGGRLPMPNKLVALAKRKTSEDDQKLFLEMAKPGGKIEVVIPNEIDPKEWKRSINVTCQVLARAQSQEQVTLVVLGRLLMVAKNSPEIMGQHASFEEFLNADVIEAYGVSRSTCFEAMGLCRWPGLETRQFESVGRRNFRLLNQAIPKGEETKSYAKTALQKASELPEEEFREFCEEKGYFSKGETVGMTLRIPMNKKQYKAATKFFADPEIVAAAGSEKMSDILDAMMSEVEIEWRHRGAEIITESAEAAPAEEADEKLEEVVE
jgi:hypothetical protein